MSEEIDFLRRRIESREQEFRGAVSGHAKLDFIARIGELKSLLNAYEHGLHLNKPSFTMAPCPECNGWSIESGYGCPRCGGRGVVDFRSLRPPQKSSWDVLTEEESPLPSEPSTRSEE